ncbi:hypothetical protein OHAE_4153 [Ochrobactrum soli]|uniref:Uncharacterized protein n=1 Tax=Ochrobactrum soli TaxID=2448455 RepID=A0A2P9HB83_9HYPH|nr:hypothetical protein OHAE_4153 [[Ochrobactrum] soli]
MFRWVACAVEKRSFWNKSSLMQRHLDRFKYEGLKQATDAFADP